MNDDATQFDSAISARLDLISRAPAGPQIAAFFDFDGTLIDGFSAKTWVKRRFARREMGARELSELLTFALIREPGDADFDELVSWAVHRMAGIDETTLESEWRQMFYEHFAAWQYPESWALVKAHQARGHTVVIASSATRQQVLPVADELGVTHLLTTTLEFIEGKATGRILGRPLWNEQKAAAARRFASSNHIQLEHSYTYSNGREDIAFLATAGHPMALNPEADLQTYASKLGWPQAHCAPRRNIPLSAKLRTMASYASMAATLLTGLGLSALGSPRRTAINFVTSVAPEIGLAIAGVKLRIVGEANLWVARPGVYIFNHQSPLDLVVGVALMRRDATGVVKKEAAEMFGWGHFMRFAGMAFVDRADSAKARDALAPAVEKLRNGISLGIAPEGTRSYSPRLGTFKKGAFHVAMQAGVPIVPVILRNMGEVMHRNATWIRPGIVDVCVLPPIDVSSWTTSDLDARVAEIRQKFQDCLDHWPETAQ